MSRGHLVQTPTQRMASKLGHAALGLSSQVLRMRIQQFSSLSVCYPFTMSYPFTVHIWDKPGSIFSIITHLEAENSTKVFFCLSFFKLEKTSSITLLRYHVPQAPSRFGGLPLDSPPLWQCLVCTREPKTGHTAAQMKPHKYWADEDIYYGLTNAGSHIAVTMERSMCHNISLKCLCRP